MDNNLKQELHSILNEDVASIFISVPLAMGIILVPWFKRHRKIKKMAKEKCAKFEGLAHKKCLVAVNIASLEGQKRKLLQSVSQCNKHPEPKRSKCKKTIQNLAKDYDVKIAKEKRKLG